MPAMEICNELLASLVGGTITKASVERTDDPTSPAHVLIEVDNGLRLRVGLQLRTLDGNRGALPEGITFIDKSKYEAFGYEIDIDSEQPVSVIGLSLMTQAIPRPSSRP
jgi:hypothetical protein